MNTIRTPLCKSKTAAFLMLCLLAFTTACKKDSSSSPNPGGGGGGTWSGKLYIGYVDDVKLYDFASQKGSVLFKGSQPQALPTGEVAYINETFPGQRQIVKLMNSGTTSSSVIFDGRDSIGGSVYDPQVSPDGNLVAFTVTSFSGYAIPSDGVLVTSKTGARKAFFKNKYTPTWLPDGRLVMAGSFTSSIGGTPSTRETPGIYISNAALTAVTRIDNNLNDPVPHQPAASPDGSKIAFVLNNHVWVMDITGASMKQVTAVDNDNEESYPRWSPDGKYIACWSYKTFENSYYTAVAIVPSDAATPVVLSNDANVWPREPKDGVSYRVSGGSKQFSWVQ